METLPRHAPTTLIRDVVERVIQRAKAELDSLIESAPGRSEHERRAELARYAHRTRQRLVRLAVVEKWATKSAKIATVATNAHLTLRAHEDAFVRIADGLFGLHQQLEWAKAPLWDLPGALDVMCNGNYSALSQGDQRDWSETADG
jgi:mediator of RNA polymerase II transcription subunit 14